MTTRLNLRQVNNLLTGTGLAVELPASTESRRAFLIVRGYREGRKIIGDYGPAKPPSKVLNADHSDVRFGFRVFEIEKEYMEHPELTDAITTYEHDLATSPVFAGVEELEGELSKYLDDFSSLDVYWRVIPYY